MEMNERREGIEQVSSEMLQDCERVHFSKIKSLKYYWINQTTVYN